MEKRRFTSALADVGRWLAAVTLPVVVALWLGGCTARAPGGFEGSMGVGSPPVVVVNGERTAAPPLSAVAVRVEVRTLDWEPVTGVGLLGLDDRDHIYSLVTEKDGTATITLHPGSTKILAWKRQLLSGVVDFAACRETIDGHNWRHVCTIDRGR